MKQTYTQVKQSIITVPHQSSNTFSFNHQTHQNVCRTNNNSQCDETLMDDQTIQIPGCYQKLLKICQNMRRQIKQLRKNNRQLQSRVNFYENINKQLGNQQNTNSLNFSRSFSQENQNQPIEICQRITQLDKDYADYKKNIYQHYKKKVKQLQIGFHYLMECYQQYTQNPVLDKKTNKLVQEYLSGQAGHPNNNIVLKLKKLYNKSECSFQGNQSHLWMMIDQKQSNKLRYKIKQLQSISMVILNEQRIQIKQLYKQIQQNKQKIGAQVLKWLKKYIKYDVNKNQIDNQKPIKSNIATPNIPMCPTSKITTSTPKSYSSTPKNRSFSRNSLSVSKANKKMETNFKKPPLIKSRVK